MHRLALLPALALLAGATATVRAADDFPVPNDTQSTAGNPLTPAEESLHRLTMPAGFAATLYASEPAVCQPIAMSFDGRGRLWVAENYTYGDGHPNFDHKLRDRILVFADSKGDGHGDQRTVFWDKGSELTSIAVGHGGVFALCPPRLLFIPDADGDDHPDGEPQVLLDGFDDDRVGHNVANGLKWGPDGWLYGRHGIQATSHVGLPGAPAGGRVAINCSIWRYHPVRHVFEAVASGTTNSWGMDWDAQGEGFFINTVIGHLWHFIPGAHYQRMGGADLDPAVYGLIAQHADHVHWATGEKWTDVRKGKPSDATSAAGGGHAHSGLMIYQGANWPAAYRGGLFTLNFHGRRVNMDSLAPEGSGFVGHHAPDVIASADPWFRGVDLDSGPDGGVYLLDWSDIGECHEHDGIHRSSGRIFKVTYGTPTAPGPLDLAKADDTALVELLTRDDAWYARQAQLLLASRAAAGHDTGAVRPRLRALLASGPLVQRLRALWTLHGIGGADAGLLIGLLGDAAPALRTWAVRLLTDALPLRGNATLPPAETMDDAVRAALEKLAVGETAPSVRLALAACLQRLPLAARSAIAAPLLAHAEDAGDHNLPLMLWYGVKDLATAAPENLARLATTGRIPIVMQYATRRLSEDLDQHPAGLDLLLQLATTPEARGAVVAGLGEGLLGRRHAAQPGAWDAFRAAAGADAALTGKLHDLDVLFGSQAALAESRHLALDRTQDAGKRRAALHALIENKPDDLRAVCVGLLDDQDVNGEAVRGLALFDDPALAGALVKRYRAGFHDDAKPAVLAALVGRASSARVLVAAIGDGPEQVPRGDLTAFHIRQLRALGDKELDAQLTAVWGVLRDSSAPKAAEIRAWTEKLSPAALAGADAGRGRRTFVQTCSACHKLFGAGGAIGPDLTGSQRSNLAFLLESVVDPSAVVAADFRLVIATLSDGRVVTGMVKSRTERGLVIQTMTEVMPLERSQIAKLQELPSSLMPEGLLGLMTPEQVRDLVAYLMGKEQVALPKE